MSEIAAARRKTKLNKEIDDIIPELPDRNLIEIIANKIEVKAENDDIKDKVNEKFDIEYNDVEEETAHIIAEEEEKFVYKSIELQKMYPSLTECKFSSILLPTTNCESAQLEILSSENNKNSLDIVTERVTRPLAPMEEWLLPEPLSMSEMRKYYRNMLLENIERFEKEFSSEMQENCHPLAELVENYQRSVIKLKNVEESLNQLRIDCVSKQSELWTVGEKIGWKEARCRDNAIVKRSYTFDEAQFNADSMKKVERILEEVIDEETLLKYEMGLSKSMVEDFLVQVRMQKQQQQQTSTSGALRECVGVLCMFLRRVPVHADCVRALHEWIVFLGVEIAAGETTTTTTRNAAEDKLYLLWELLHAPAGVAEWSAGLVQTGDDYLL